VWLVGKSPAAEAHFVRRHHRGVVVDLVFQELIRFLFTESCGPSQPPSLPGMLASESKTPPGPVGAHAQATVDEVRPRGGRPLDGAGLASVLVPVAAEILKTLGSLCV